MKTFFAIALTAGLLGLGAGMANGAAVNNPGHPGGGNPNGGGGNPNGGGPNPGGGLGATHYSGDISYVGSCPFVWKFNAVGQRYLMKKCRPVQ